jgi:hypothetical protein
LEEFILSEEKTKPHKNPLPTYEAIEKMIQDAFPAAHSMCPLLCIELQNAVDALSDAPTPQAKAHALVRLHAIAAQVKAHNCHCTPQ